MIWDRGSWTPLDPNPQAAYAKGNLKFVLDGAEAARQMGAGADGRQACRPQRTKTGC